MKVEDFERYKLAYIKARHAQGRPIDDSQRDAWWEYLEPYSIEAVEHGIKRAVLEAGRFEVAVGDIASHAKDYMQSHGGSVPRDNSPGWRCAQCDGTGWAPVVPGRAVTSWQDIRDSWRDPAPLVHKGTKRCECKTARRAS